MAEYNVVVVDNNTEDLSRARDIVESDNMNAICLKSGQELLDYVEENTPDLILLENVMTEMDGFDTYISLRKFEEHKGRMHIPVIFMSGDEGVHAEEMGLILGASDFVRKPLNRDVLIRRVRNAIKNSRYLENLREEATVDKLTGLLNKARGTERVSKLCKRKKGALMILDLDSFKLVNDLYGHEMGDQILIAFANIIRKNSRETDTLCRIGGDEFMGFYEDLTEVRNVKSLTERLNTQLEAATKKILGEDNVIPLGISIGVVMVPENGTEYENLFSYADSALYRVKQNGKHGFAIYGEGPSDAKDNENPEQKLDRLLQIVEERNDKAGPLVLGRDYFSSTYKFIMRFFKRYGGDAAIILFELYVADADLHYIMEVSDVFNDVVEKSLRISDIIMQNGTQSYFVLLTECGKDDIEKVVKRITKTFEETEFGSSVTINYIYKYLEKKAAKA